jgi:predicted nucleic acid-binding protein
MTELVFVDTNVLVYRFDIGKPDKQKAADAWVSRLWETHGGRLSFQVLREFYVTVTGKLPNKLETGAARNVVRTLLAWKPIACSDRIIGSAWEIEDRYSISWWDALIVAAAREQACTILLTEDLQDGQVLAGVRVTNPFSVVPGDLLD